MTQSAHVYRTPLEKFPRLPLLQTDMAGLAILAAQTVATGSKKYTLLLSNLPPSVRVRRCNFVLPKIRRTSIVGRNRWDLKDRPFKLP